MSTTGPLSVVKKGNVTVVEFGPAQRHLTEVGLEDISRQLVEVAQSADPPYLVLDMAATEFFGSSFIEVLFRVWKKLSTHTNPKFALSGLQEYCQEVLAVTHLDQLWPLYGTSDEAVKAFSA